MRATIEAVAGRRQQQLPPLDPSLSGLRRELLRVALELRVTGPERCAERIERVAEVLAPRPLRGIVDELGRPSRWPTPELVSFLADALMEADAVIRRLEADAEITGSDQALAAARAWREKLAL